MDCVDEEKQKFEKTMEQFKGKRFPCALCGKEGEYSTDLGTFFTNMGELGKLGELRENTCTPLVERNFACKDVKACYQRQKTKK